MAERSFPFDAGAGATVLEVEWQKMAREWLATGVITGRLNQLAVSADGSARSVTVASGRGWVDGFAYENDAALAQPIDAADASNPRIDRIVVRLDRTANEARVRVVKGTPAASPVAPALTQTDALYELLLADVTVPAAAGVIVASNVTDRRTFSKNLTEAAGNAAYKLALDAAYLGGQTTTSTAYADLATVGPVATVDVPASGQVLVIIGCGVSNDTAGGNAYASFAGSGANVLGADDARAVGIKSAIAGAFVTASHLELLEGLTPGATTFTAKYRVSAGTGSFNFRRLTVVAIP